ncbi:hypothetical protein GXW78_17345 [Roseomonas terrae]|uniref:Peptidase C58 YopT-type domain-containing protein n=1 Tax=Neoroseomonas terrae TaxID=424799 RepID=A0ABS5EK83_9PROT|nr:hypothetical protein [Neoroseomonas terrae]MBR0651439.1 hypothetical protein [Neoroseomonas terrae]
MDQGATLGNDQEFHALFNAPLTDGKRQGICCGLSMVWVARRIMFHDETPDQRKAALVSQGGFRFGGRSQDIMMASDGDGTTEETYKGWFGPALETYVLRIIGGTVIDNPRPASLDVLVSGATTTGAYCLYNIGIKTSKGNAAHMIASYCSHGTFGLGFNRSVYFYDPNMGEYRIGTDDVVPFLRAFRRSYEDEFLGLNDFDQFQVERG